MITLRPSELRDADTIYRYRTDEEVTFWAAGGFGDAFPTRTQIEDQIKAQKAGAGQMLYAIEVHAEDQAPRMIGTIGFRMFDRIARKVTIGMLIGERAYWGKGYGTDALRQFVRLLFTRYNLNRIELDTFSDNQRAIRAYEKVGFQVEGVQRQGFWTLNGYRDRVLMGLLRADWQALQDGSSAYLAESAR